MRSKGFLGLVFLAIVIFMAGCSGCNSYNDIVGMDESVDQAWSNVENVYQRRADLIPGLVETVKGATQFENDQLDSISELQDLMNGSKSLTGSDNSNSFLDQQNKIGDVLKNVFANNAVQGSESASESFRDLQVQIEGANNRISTERRRYNEVVTAYNKRIRKFPANIVAAISGFGERSTFEASEGAQNAPEVNL